MMWTHLCKPQNAWLSTEKGKPCNWCDAAEKPADEWDNRLKEREDARPASH